MADERLTVEELKNWRKKKVAEFQEKNKDNKMLLREILNIEKVRILSEGKTKSGDTINIRVPFCEVDKKTKNSRIYSEWLMKRELGKVRKAVESGSFLGMSDHPESGLGTVKDTSHIVEKLELDEKGIGWADLKILSTSKGKDIQTIIRENGRLGISMRGAGTVSKDGQVQGDYAFLGLDICLNPSVENAMFDKSNIVESVNFQEPNPPSEELIQFILDGVYEQRQERGHTETYEEFLEEHGAVIKAGVLVESGIYDSVEEALIKMGEEKTLRKLKSEEATHIYTADEVYWEARTAGVDPKKFAEKLNEIQTLKRVDLESGLSEKEVGGLMEEATKAGVDVKDLEERKKYFEFAKTQATPSEKTLHEKAVDIQKRMLAEGKKENLDFIKTVLREEDEKKNIQKRRLAIRAQCEREIDESGAFKSHEESRKFIDRQLKAAGLPILEEGE